MNECEIGRFTTITKPISIKNACNCASTDALTFKIGWVFVSKG